jgi:Ca2+-binding EF-hand superfamily protein
MERLMKTSLRIALLLGVVSIMVGTGNAQVASLADGGRNSERSADRLLRDFDRNGDGRVTHDEMNRTIGWRFASATRHAPRMSLDQFINARADAFRQRNADTFRGLDWNADGRLTLGEFAASQRVRFMSLDREGAGAVSCAVTGRGGSWRGGLSAFCADNDTNMDGRVTRAELDGAVARRFAQATGGANAMSLSQFQISEQQRFATANARAFRRLDVDEDGTLTVQEFGGADLKTFARLDTNKDGILAADEMRPRNLARADRSQKRRYD